MKRLERVEHYRRVPSGNPYILEVIRAHGVEMGTWILVTTTESPWPWAKAKQKGGPSTPPPKNITFFPWPYLNFLRYHRLIIAPHLVTKKKAHTIPAPLSNEPRSTQPLLAKRHWMARLQAFSKHWCRLILIYSLHNIHLGFEGILWKWGRSLIKLYSSLSLFCPGCCPIPSEKEALLCSWLTMFHLGTLWFPRELSSTPVGKAIN